MHNYKKKALSQIGVYMLPKNEDRTFILGLYSISFSNTPCNDIILYLCTIQDKSVYVKKGERSSEK